MCLELADEALSAMTFGVVYQIILVPLQTRAVLVSAAVVGGADIPPQHLAVVARLAAADPVTFIVSVIGVDPDAVVVVTDGKVTHLDEFVCVISARKLAPTRLTVAYGVAP